MTVVFCFFFSSRRRHTRCALVTGVQTCALPIYLSGAWTVDETWDVVSAAGDDNEAAVRFRRGWFLGDGTGAGKGRQVAGIILDNWLKGRRRALWISKSDKLLEDAQRDWSALGQERLLVTPLSRFRQGTPVRLAEG